MRRHDAEHDAGGNRQREADRDHAAVEAAPRSSRGRSAGIMATIQSFSHASATSAAAPPADRDDQTLDEQLSYELTARRAERTAHRDLAHAARRAREREVRDVHARDGEQQSDRAHQHAERRADAIRQLALHALESQRPLHVGRIVGRIRRPQIGGERVETILRLRQRDARLETSHHAGDEVLLTLRRARERRRGEAARAPHVHVAAHRLAGMTEVARHDADDRVRVGVHDDFASDDVARSRRTRDARGRR